MPQVTQGVRSILSKAAVYDAVQNLLGAKRSRQRLVEEYIRPVPGDVVLDVGCGTGAILDSMPDDIQYVGIDLSPRYIASAEERYGHRATFRCMDVAHLSASDLPPANIAVAIGLLHHLGDDEASMLLIEISRCLVERGRLVTIDPCFEPTQSFVARYAISRDRGQNVREPDCYAAIARSVFVEVKVTVRHDLARIPYTHTILECRK